MLRLWNRKTKTVTVTRNLVLELKYDTVNKKINKKMITTCRVGQATEIFTCPTELSYLPRRAVLIVIPCKHIAEGKKPTCGFLFWNGGRRNLISQPRAGCWVKMTRLESSLSGSVWCQTDHGLQTCTELQLYSDKLSGNGIGLMTRIKLPWFCTSSGTGFIGHLTWGFQITDKGLKGFKTVC